MEKKQRKIEGVVVSDKMTKTITVSVTHSRIHPKYLKSYKVTNKFKAHDEGEVCNIGDRVTIAETRPLSRTKRWIVLECIPSAKSAQPVENTESNK